MAGRVSPRTGGALSLLYGARRRLSNVVVEAETRSISRHPPMTIHLAMYRKLLYKPPVPAFGEPSWLMRKPYQSVSASRRSSRSSLSLRPRRRSAA